MKLYLLKPKNLRLWRHYYDMYHGGVVRASSAKRARAFMASLARDEGYNAWLDPRNSTCTILKPEGREGIVLLDGRNG